MVSASLGIIACEFIAVSIVSGYILWYYKSPHVTFDVTVSVYLAWVLGFSGILLLPYDLSFSEVNNLESVRLAEVWSFIYFATFFLAWIVLPIQMEFHNSGYFNFYGKVCYNMLIKQTYT